MQLLITSTKNNLIKIREELLREDFQVENNFIEDNQKLKIHIFEYQFTFALQCIKQCHCQETFDDIDEKYHHLANIKYPHVVIYIIHDDKKMSF